ncbi:hypothetical protein JG687_00012339 [Phytophthora cactorum]|uniref:Uncharacterized protein n=1 Tax=Phytophthora cactorum TaxID=29920 RepID=A0A8T1U2A6_9STRA|nr:hypothetical protein GQ600_11773 [Phytophthora cactorum]KAG6953534.1 hypothetical protein JG687_00012339 [Phytophthora cactorum]
MQSARKAMYIKLHVSPEALKAGTISRETIRKSVEYHGYLVHAEAHGRKPDPPPKQLQQIINLRKVFVQANQHLFLL